MGDLNLEVLEIARRARKAALKMSNVNTDSKNQAILEIAKEIDNARLKLQEINRSDVNAATKDDLQSSLLKRLKLNDSKIDDIIKGLQSLADLDDPVGKTLLSIEMDQGLELFKQFFIFICSKRCRNHEDLWVKIYDPFYLDCYVLSCWFVLFNF